MEIQGVTNMQGGSADRTNKPMGKDEFLKILVTQLQYQDPLNPVDDTEFIAQMAQFSALEQMQNLNTTFTMSQALSLIGKDVIAKIGGSETGEIQYITGTVESVYSGGGTPYLRIGEYYVHLDAVDEVLSEPLSNGEADGEEAAEKV
jgi:flagellar basal-body rod modification protein FlgD